MEKCNLYNYADDNFISYISKCPSEAIDSLTHDLKISVNWFHSNGMQANPEKFQFLALSSNITDTYEIPIDVGTVIKSEKHVKAFGVIIDNRLNFTEHISVICKKAAKQLNALSRISNQLDPNSRKVIL